MAEDSLSFALGVPHTPWRPERVASLERLFGSLAPEIHADEVAVFHDREPNWVWSERLWQWACVTDATHLLQLQDDVLVAPDFWHHLRAMVAARPAEVIGLEAAHPRSHLVETTWYTTLDMLIGCGYVVPIPLLRTFLAWREELRKGAVETVSEDTLLGLWCFVTGREIFHPVPTIIDHDTDLPSTYGNDAHEHRRPPVTWKERAMPKDWRGDVTRLGRFYQATPRLARRWVVGATEEQYLAWEAMR